MGEEKGVGHGMGRGSNQISKDSFVRPPGGVGRVWWEENICESTAFYVSMRHGIRHTEKAGAGGLRLQILVGARNRLTNNDKQIENDIHGTPYPFRKARFHTESASSAV
jgi:hypothetical protein